MVGLKAMTGRLCIGALVVAMAVLAVESQQSSAPPPQPGQESAPDVPREPLASATPKTAPSNIPIQFQSHGLDYEALTKNGITVMFAPLPQQLKEFHILQVTVTNGSLVSWTVRAPDFSFVRQDGTTMIALTADEVVSSLLDKASRNDVIKLQLLYENTIYALANYRPTNGYEQRREAALAQFVNLRFSAAAAASAIALAPVKLRPGDSTDGAIFFDNHPKEKNLGVGLLVAHTCGETFNFQTVAEPKLK
jgi:hypothetical protein